MTIFIGEFINCLELINIQTPEYEAIMTNNDFHKLSIEEDKKPCLFIVTHLTSIEYYAMNAMNLFSSTVQDMVVLLRCFHIV